MREGRHPCVEEHGDRDAHDVDREAPTRPGRGDDEATDGRAEQAAGLPAQGVECVGCGQLVVTDRAGQQRLLARPLQCPGRHEEGRHDEEHPDVRLVAKGVERHLGRTGADQHLLAVHMVGERASPQARDEQRHEFDDADQADHRVRAGQCVDLPRDRHIGDRLPECEDGAGQNHEAEVA